MMISIGLSPDETSKLHLHPPLSGDGSCQSRDNFRRAGALEGLMKELILLHGQVALVDDTVYKVARDFSWTLNSDGYVARWYRAPSPARGKRGKLHCVKLHDLVLPRRPGLFVDHKHHNLLDNRRSQLRYATIQSNGRNRIKQQKPSSSRYKGVCFSKKAQAWQATIGVGKSRNKWIGYFPTEQAAARAYNQRARRLYRSFACLNRL